MKYPTRSKVFRELVSRTATATGEKVSDVEEVVEFYLKTTSQFIRMDRNVNIHIDYLGDFRYNEVRRQKATEAHANKNRLNGVADIQSGTKSDSDIS